MNDKHFLWYDKHCLWCSCLTLTFNFDCAFMEAAIDAADLQEAHASDWSDRFSVGVLLEPMTGASTLDVARIHHALLQELSRNASA